MKQHQVGWGAAESTLPTSMLRRRPRHRKSVYHRPFPRGWFLIGLLAVGLLSSGGYLLWAQRTATYAVYLGDAPLVALASEDAARAALRDLRRKFAPRSPERVSFVEGEPHIAPVTKAGLRAQSVPQAVTALDARLTAVLEGYAIYVNGQPMVMVDSKNHAAEAIALMLQRGARGQKGIPTFQQRVTIVSRRQVEGEADALPVRTPAQVAALLVHPPVPHWHTIVQGDNMWDIANANGMTLAQLKAMNPTVDPHNMKIGDKLKLPDRPSPVTIVTRPTVAPSRGKTATQHSAPRS